MSKYVAVLGAYRSGSSVVASMLDALGVDMGAPYHGEFFEPADLAASLRRWWSEPKLVAAESFSNRVYLLRQWADSRSGKPWVGAKHPLLSLCAQDLIRGWGSDTKFIWCNRSLSDSVASLQRLNWWPNALEIQQKLYHAVESFFPRANGLIINFADTVERPEWVVRRIIDFLGIEVNSERISIAKGLVRVRKSEIGQREELSSRSNSSLCEVGNNSSDASIDSVNLSSKDSLTSNSDGSGGIIATLLCGNNENVVSAAVASVINNVDRIVLIDTGITDRSREIIGELAQEKLVIRRFEWCDDFSKARNFALEAASQLNAKWALTIDTDERLEFGSLSSVSDLAAELDSSANAQAWMVEAKSGNYQKERFIRLPTTLRWQGRTHEALCGASHEGRPKLTKVTFWEEPKTKASFQYKLNRDLKILREELSNNPEAGRTWYYLGQTLYGLGQIEGAIAAFDRCATIRAWDELSAWACFRAAKCLSDSKRFDEAIERCSIGLAIDPLYPELAWMAAWCCLQLNMPRRAIVWANMSASLGAISNSTPLYERIGFRDLVGWYDGPFEVMCVAYEQLGNMDGLRIARQNLQAAKSLRMGRSKSVTFNSDANATK